MIAGTLEIQMLTNLARIGSDMKQVKSMVGSTMGSVEKSIAAASKAFSALGVGLSAAGVVAFMKSTVAAASEAEQAQNRLTAVIRATGDVSGFTREQLDKMTDSLARSTTFDDEGIRNAQSGLLKFGKLHGETFERALKLSADYASFTGTDMAAATQLVGKALADPVAGVTQLGRALGTLTAAQKESIEQFTAQGRIAEAQEVIFRKLETSIGGTAALMNTGLFGATTATAKAWDDMLEAIGKSSAVKGTAETALGLIESALRKIQAVVENGNWTDTVLAILGAASPLKSLSQAIVSSTLTTDTSGRTATGRIGGTEQRTPDEIAAQARGSAAVAEEARLAVMETAAKKEAELVIQRAKSREQISQETYKRWQDQMKAHLGVVADLRKADFENAVAMGEGMRELFEANEDHKREVGIATGAHMRDLFEAAKEAQVADVEALRNGLMTQDEVRLFSYENDFNMLQKALDDKLVAQNTYYTLLGRLIKKNEAQQIAIEREKHESLRNMQIGTWQLGSQLLQQMAGESKAAAIASIAINKGLAIAMVIQNMTAGAARAFMDFPYPIALGIAGSIKALAGVQIGLIAATGLMEAHNVGSGGADLGTPANPISTTPGIGGGTVASSTGSGQTTIVHFQGGTESERKMIRRFAAMLNENSRDGNLVVVD